MPITDYGNELLAPRKILRWFVLAAVPSAIFYALSVLILKISGFEIMEILRDPAQQSGQSSFLGFISNIGVWLWISAATICLFHGATSNSVGGKDRKELLLFMALLSMLLAVDDFFMIHDRYIDQNLCYLAYATIALGLLIRCHSAILRIDGFAFVAAGLLLALSILTDLTQSRLPLRYSHSQLIEEGFKFCGAATWLYFSCLVARHGQDNRV